MVSRDNLVYSIASASRILGVKRESIKGFKRFWKVCWIWIKGQRPFFISKLVFNRHFAEHRQRQGAELTAKSWPEAPQWYTVENQAKGTSYPVTLEDDGPECACHDYQNQVVILGKGICKHGYAVLLKLGYGSLREYLAA